MVIVHDSEHVIYNASVCSAGIEMLIGLCVKRTAVNIVSSLLPAMEPSCTDIPAIKKSLCR